MVFLTELGEGKEPEVLVFKGTRVMMDAPAEGEAQEPPTLVLLFAPVTLRRPAGPERVAGSRIQGEGV